MPRLKGSSIDSAWSRRSSRRTKTLSWPALDTAMKPAGNAPLGSWPTGDNKAARGTVVKAYPPLAVGERPLPQKFQLSAQAGSGTINPLPRSSMSETAPLPVSPASVRPSVA